MESKLPSIQELYNNRLDDFNNMEDPVIPKNIGIYCFEMQKKGRGWKTQSSKWSMNGTIYPYNTDLNVNKQHQTLSKIKDDFFGTEFCFKCVIDGNLLAPSSLYQLIIECKDENQYNEVKRIIKENRGLNFECLIEYEWIDQIPSDIIKNLLEY